MGWTASPFAAVVFVSAGVAVGVGVVALRRRPDPMAWPLSILMFSVAAWTIPHAISLGYADVEQAALWHRLRYPGVAVAPVAYLVVALRYADHERWLSRRTYAALGVIPAVSTAIVWTNPVHGLYWRSLSVVRVGGAPVLVESYGPWYTVNIGYLYLVTAAGLVVFGAVVVRSGPLYRKQALAMFVGGVIPLATNVANQLGLGPGPGIDFTATALAATGLTFALALFHFDLLEVRPVARDRLLEEIEDGVVVIGPEGRIRDFNRTAVRILGDIALDQPAAAVLPSDVAADGGEVVAEIDGRDRQFRTRSSTLTDDRGRRIGRVVLLDDITDLMEREQRITVLNRILRHNIRNELNVASGWLEMQAEHESWDEREPVRKATESIDRVLEFAEKARHIERTVRGSGAEIAVPAAATVERVVTDLEERYDDAVIEYEPPADAAVRVVDAELFETSITELVENAIVHNDRNPRVTVAVEPGADRVRISVADNGPGIPEQEAAVLSRGETELEHGSGVGLWLVEWTASLSAGELSFEENDPRGTVATLSLPAADG